MRSLILLALAALLVAADGPCDISVVGGDDAAHDDGDGDGEEGEEDVDPVTGVRLRVVAAANSIDGIDIDLELTNPASGRPLSVSAEQFLLETDDGILRDAARFPSYLACPSQVLLAEGATLSCRLRFSIDGRMPVALRFLLENSALRAPLPAIVRAPCVTIDSIFFGEDDTAEPHSIASGFLFNQDLVQNDIALPVGGDGPDIAIQWTAGLTGTARFTAEVQTELGGPLISSLGILAGRGCGDALQAQNTFVPAVSVPVVAGDTLVVLLDLGDQFDAELDATGTFSMVAEME
jgi:hypothetical protein